MPGTEPSMRVLFDATRLAARAGFPTPTGIDRVDLAYARWLRGQPDIAAEFLVLSRFGPQLLTPKSAAHLVESATKRWTPNSLAPTEAYAALKRFLVGDARAQPSRQSAEPASWRPEARYALTHLVGAQRLKRLMTGGANDLIYLNTSHGRLFRPDLRRWLARSPASSIFFVHDLIPIDFPEFSGNKEPERHAARLETVTRHASAVLVNSLSTRDSLRSYCREKRLPQPPITVAPLGVESHFDRLDARPAELREGRPYFVVVGTIEPRKNHALLLELWRRLAQQQGRDAPRLVILGRRGWDNQSVFKLLDRSTALTELVIECPGLNDAEVAEVLHGARALLQPSFAEGYGLPLVEALSLGTPVVASDLPAHREIGGAHAEYLDPVDGRSWLQAIQTLAKPDSQGRQGPQLFQPPRWSTHFDLARQMLEAVSSRSADSAAL